MGLSPDEQKKIQEEEKIRIKTRNEQEARGCATILGILFLIIVLSACLSGQAAKSYDAGSYGTEGLPFL